MSDYAMRQNLRSVDQWGKVQRQSFQYAFYNIYNLEILATDTPNFSGVTDVSYMFHYVYNLTGNFKNWNLDGVINAYAMFHSAHNFNSSVAGRNVSTIQNMNEMFAYAYIFDQDLSSWNPTDLMYASQILYYTSLSTRNYNELLASRAQQPLQDNVQLHHVGGYDGGATMYGGCGVANGPAGIAGHDTLAKEKGWYFYDGGAGICPPVPYSGQLVFTRKVGGGTYCINGIDGNEEGNTVIVDWGDGSAAIPTLDGSNLCHNYTKNATYAVRISSPEELTSLNLSSSYIKSLTLGDATNLVTLDLSNNQNPNIRNLLAGQTAKLAHLESINLSYNEITTLVPTMLSGLKNLMYFYCYGNKIQTIPNGFFASAPNLQYIDMNSNQIASLQSGAFAGLSALGHLYLHENQLHTITAGTFVGLSNLSTLHLGNNQLYTIETGAFTNAFQDRGRFYIENNNLKTLPASFPSEVGNIYIYSYNNCLDPTFMTAGVQSLLATYDRNWHNNQYLCTEVSYDPAKPAS